MQYLSEDMLTGFIHKMCVCVMHACMASWSLYVFLIRSWCLHPCSPWAECCPLAKWKAGPLGRQGGTIYLALLWLRLYYLPWCYLSETSQAGIVTGGGRWMMGLKTQPVLLRWQTGASAGGMWREERRERARVEAGQGMNIYTGDTAVAARQRTQFTAPVGCDWSKEKKRG